MREWLRLLAEQRRRGDAGAARGRRPARGRCGSGSASSTSERSRDFSHQVYDAMSGCLACKACATQCPVRVDVPDFRAQFLELYHRRYARPLGDYFTALLERMLPLMAAAPRLANALMGNAARSLADDARHRHRRRAAARPAARGGAPRRSTASRSRRVADLERLPKDARVVVVLQDAFTTFYEPGVLEASCLLLRALGFEPHVLPYFENGKALAHQGLLARVRAGRRAQRRAPAQRRGARLSDGRHRAGGRAHLPRRVPEAARGRRGLPRAPPAGVPASSGSPSRARGRKVAAGAAASACCRTAPSRRS